MNATAAQQIEDSASRPVTSLEVIDAPARQAREATRAETGTSRVAELVYQLPLVKAMCVLGVISIHEFSGYFYNTKARLTPFRAMVSLLCSLGEFAVPLFIALSSFYLCLNRRNERAIPFYKRTLKLLLIPYVTYSILYSLIAIGRRSGVEAIWSFKTLWSILVNLVCGTATQHLWFMLFIIQVYLAFPYLRRWFRPRKHKGLLLGAAMIAQYAWPLYKVPKCPVRLLPGHLGYVFAGFCLYDYGEAILRRLQGLRYRIAGWIVWFASAVAITAYVLRFDAKTPAYTWIRSAVLPVMSLGAICALLSLAQSAYQRRGLLYGLLNSIGLHAFGMYLFHLITALLTHGIVRKIGVNKYLYTPLTFALVVFGTLLAVKVLARTRLGKYLS